MFSTAILFFLKANSDMKKSNGEPGLTGKNSDKVTFNVQNDLEESLQEAESLDEGTPEEESKEEVKEEIKTDI